MSETSAIVIALDLGTSSNRCILFNSVGQKIGLGQREFSQIMPQAGWVEHDPIEILESVLECVTISLEDAAKAEDVDIQTIRNRIKALGITNQRETSLIWSRSTGKPFHNALVWMDTRTKDICQILERDAPDKLGKDRFREKTGLPIATYFSSTKWKWLMENVPEVHKAVASGDALFGTIDTWLIWNLTGGKDGGIHATDVTNASRTQLMNLKTLQWDEDILSVFGIPSEKVLPKILSSSSKSGFGKVKSGILRGIPITGVLGDQQAALFGQACFRVGDAKNTYGTGCFMLLNTGQSMYNFIMNFKFVFFFFENSVPNEFQT